MASAADPQVSKATPFMTTLSSSALRKDANLITARGEPPPELIRIVNLFFSVDY